MEHQTNTNTDCTVPLLGEFNGNKGTETSTNERITKTNGRSMKYRNTCNGIISTFVKLQAYFLIDVWYASNLKGAASIQSYVQLSIMSIRSVMSRWLVDVSNNYNACES